MCKTVIEPQLSAPVQKRTKHHHISFSPAHCTVKLLWPPSIKFDHGSTSWQSCLFDCCSVACGCRDLCGRNNLCPKSRICVWSLVCWSCCAPFCLPYFLLLYSPASLPLSGGVGSECFSTGVLQGPPRISCCGPCSRPHDVKKHRQAMQQIWPTRVAQNQALGVCRRICSWHPSMLHSRERRLTVDDNHHIERIRRKMLFIPVDSGNVQDVP